MLHLETKLLEVLPLLRLLPIVDNDIGLFRTSGGTKADPPGAPVFHLLLRARLDASDELLHGLERASVAQEQIDEGRKSPVVSHRPPSPGLMCVAATTSPSLVSHVDAKILPRPSDPKEPRGDPLDTIDRTFDLR